MPENSSAHRPIPPSWLLALNDSLALSAALVPPAVSLMLFPGVIYAVRTPGIRWYESIAQNDSLISLLYFLCALTVGGFLFLGYRIVFLRRLYRLGIAVPGSVVSIYVGRRSGPYVTYRYEFLSQSYTRSVQFDGVPALKAQQVITVLLDPSDPNSSVIEEIYSRPFEGFRLS